MTDSSADPSAWHQLKAVPRCRCAASEAVGHDAMTQKNKYIVQHGSSTWVY